MLASLFIYFIEIFYSKTVLSFSVSMQDCCDRDDGDDHYYSREPKVTIYSWQMDLTLLHPVPAEVTATCSDPCLVLH